MTGRRPRKVVRLVTACGCTRDMEVPYSARAEPWYEIPVVRDPNPGIGESPSQPFPPMAGRIHSRRFEYHETIAEGDHVVEVYREILR